MGAQSSEDLNWVSLMYIFPLDFTGIPKVGLMDDNGLGKSRRWRIQSWIPQRNHQWWKHWPQILVFFVWLSTPSTNTKLLWTSLLWSLHKMFATVRYILQSITTKAGILSIFRRKLFNSRYFSESSLFCSYLKLLNIYHVCFSYFKEM